MPTADRLRSAGAWKPRSYDLVRTKPALLDFMVGEAVVHVQGSGA